MSSYDHQAPDKLKNAALLQLVSGAVNISVMAFMSYICIGGCFATLSAPIGSPCAIFGLAGCLLWPIGMFELVAGAMFFTNPRQHKELARIAAGVEVVSLLLGGFFSAFVGGMVLMTLGDEQVQEYLDSEPPDPELLAAKVEVEEVGQIPKSTAEKVRAVASDQSAVGEETFDMGEESVDWDDETVVMTSAAMAEELRAGSPGVLVEEPPVDPADVPDPLPPPPPPPASANPPPPPGMIPAPDDLGEPLGTDDVTLETAEEVLDDKS